MEQLNLQPVKTKSAQPVFSQVLNQFEFILEQDVAALEDKLAKFVDAPFCVAVSDAASGIALALRTAGIGAGDRVLCAALGCAVPVQGIMLAGAAPIFVDVNPNTYTVDPFCVEYALGKLARSEEKMPRALIATDLFGAPCHYGQLEEVCRQRGMTLIEDFTGAFGARFAGGQAGNFGRFSVASFASPSPLDELGGGAVFCRDEEDARRLAGMRRVNRQEFIGELGTAIPCMSSTDTALINEKLEDVARQNQLRQKAAARYRKMLRGKVRMQQLVSEGESIYSQFVVALPRARARSLVSSRLYSMNIPCGAPVCGKQTGHSDWNRVMLINTLAVSDRLLSLPIHPYLSDHLVDYICECLMRAIDGGGF